MSKLAVVALALTMVACQTHGLVAPSGPLSRRVGGLRMRSLLTFAAVGGGGRATASMTGGDTCSTTLYDIPVSNNGARVSRRPSRAEPS